MRSIEPFLIVKLVCLIKLEPTIPLYLVFRKDVVTSRDEVLDSFPNFGWSPIQAVEDFNFERGCLLGQGSQRRKATGKLEIYVSL